MNQPRSCGCKGCRTCLFCEKNYNLTVTKPFLNCQNSTYVYCSLCQKAWPGWKIDDNVHSNHKGESIDFPGIFLQLDFISPNEESNVVENIDELPWNLSQSGRRKQNFGPKCNFKKKKIRSSGFNGFPKTTKFLQERFESVHIMKGFQTIEQCFLEYVPERGSSIDPHVDDCWIWGERIVTVNLLSDSVLTMTYNNKVDRYNLDCVQSYPAILLDNGEFNTNNHSYHLKDINSDVSPVVRIPMPRRSLLIMYNSARYDWQHEVLRSDIKERRVCIAYREFTPPYLSTGKEYNSVHEIHQNALKFLG